MDDKHRQNGKATNVPLLDFEAAPAGGGRVQLLVKREGEAVHLDTLNYASAKDRRRLFDDLGALLKADPEVLFVAFNASVITAATKALAMAEELAKQQAPQESESDRIAPAWPTPWTDEVRLSDVLTETYAAIRRHILLTHEAAVATALWVLWSYAVDRSPTGPAGDVCPILCVTSPTRRCGKTSLLSVLLHLCPGAVPASNLTAASMYRLIEKERPVLIVDEADTFGKDNPELVGIINSGHRRELAYVARCVGDDHVPKKFSTWCPKVLALIGKPSATVLDRSIVIRLQRKRPDESTERLNNQAVERLKTIARKLAKAVTDDVRAMMYRSDPAIPTALHDRAADNWRNLLALADLAGGCWPTEARKSAVVLSLDDGEPESLGVQAIIDAVSVFGNVDRLRPEELVERLCGTPDRPWPTISRGRPLTAKKLASLLAPYGVQAVRDHGGRWYLKTDFLDAFQRYYAPPPETICQSVTDASKCLSDNDLRRDGSKIENETEIQSVTAQVLDNQGLTCERDGLTDRNGGVDENEETEWVF